MDMNFNLMVDNKNSEPRGLRGTNVAETSKYIIIKIFFYYSGNFQNNQASYGPRK